MTSSISDLTLVKQAQSGDSRAFDALVIKYQHRIVQLVLRYVRNQAEAEDVAQDCFIKAYRALATFRGDSAFYTWLYRIAINTAKNSLSARSRSPIRFGIDDAKGDFSVEMQEYMKDNVTPESLVLTNEISVIINAAIAQLPEDLRVAIIFRELEGLSYEEIAHAMECPVGTVRSRIFRAREDIHLRLLDVFPGGLGRDRVFE
ncbi:MAG: RNA polymerase sigma factor RpoE [Gammaproteobacteria bacterium]|nr:RNA polymerase sigma factor RpoE [Gammaproteobacteria bacterium]